MSLREAHRQLIELLAQYGNVPLLFSADGDRPHKWGRDYGLGLWLEEMGDSPKDDRPYVIYTGDGHLNPVRRISLWRSRTSGRVGVCLTYNSLEEHAERDASDEGQ